MNYEIVSLPEQTLVGIGLKSNNSDPQLSEKIGQLWNQFFAEKVYEEIKNKKSNYPICLYSNYGQISGGDATTFTYDVTVGYNATKDENSEYIVKIIPASKYARFLIKGNMVTAVSAAWQEIWETPLNRSFTGDFEEYLNESMEEAEVAIYIALKE